MRPLLSAFLLIVCVLPLSAADPANESVLPSWNAGPSRDAIIRFVTAVTDESSPSYVEPAERIAVFDNDGTLWGEQPAYFQLLFAIDRIKAMAADHPEWKETEPFASILSGDTKQALAGGHKAILEIFAATHAGMTAEEFDAVVSDWVATAKHPTTGRPYTEMVYQPMLELLDYLRAHDIKTYIVSGGGIDFMRPWVGEVYGIPPEQVVGSSLKAEFVIEEGKPLIRRVGEIDFIDDKAGKPVGIYRHIGRRPIAAFGNSDGDLQMLQWTGAGEGERLCVFIHHTDAEREWAYDRDSKIGHFDAGLDEAADKGWVIVDMQREWKSIFPPAE